MIILTYRCLIPDVFEKDVKCLKQLDADVVAAVLIHDLQEEAQHVALQKETESTKTKCITQHYQV